MDLYSNFKVQDGIFAAVECADWPDFKASSSQILKTAAGLGPVFERFLFRGQSCSSWPLMSSFDRKHADLPFRSMDDKYRRVLESFTKAYEIYGDMDGRPIDTLFRRDKDRSQAEYEAIAQHFGMPTRLLDWTSSLYVAAFFAFSKVEECSSGLVSIWALNRERASNVFSERHVEFLDDIYKENRRQLWQMGVFIVNHTDRRDLADIFRASSDYYDKALKGRAPLLIRFDLPKEAVSDALDDLNMMRINSITLFPGIEGVVRWIDRGGYAID